MSEEVKKRPVYVVSTIKGPLSNRLFEGYQRASSGIYFNQDSKHGAANEGAAANEMAAANEPSAKNI